MGDFRHLLRGGPTAELKYYLVNSTKPNNSTDFWIKGGGPPGGGGSCYFLVSGTLPPFPLVWCIVQNKVI